MTKEEFLKKADELYEKYNPPTLEASRFPYLESDLLDLFLDYKRGD